VQRTVATTVNCADSPSAIVAFVQVIIPEPPTAGVLQAQAGGAAKDTKAVSAGTKSCSVTLPAHAGPLLVAVIVYVTFVPAAIAPAGIRVFVTARSASHPGNMNAATRVAHVCIALVTG
jgi:hypothetical protein